MKIGMIGAGKLGLPVALAIESKGHDVEVYDINTATINSYLEQRKIPYREKDLQSLLDTTQIETADSIAELVKDKDIVFCAVQTPHRPEHEGHQPLSAPPEDFDYTYLKTAIADVATAAKDQMRPVTLAVISTCLPGTFRREIKPLLNEYVEYVYTPQFIAMGTVLEDYLTPEFNLIGVHSDAAATNLAEFYGSINNAPPVVTDITTAEGIKVSYNTWITAKTVIANAWGEMCDELNMNFDDMFYAWSLSDKRLLSSRYMKAGMGDGGGCHPRDNIAMSFLAHRRRVHDIWGDLMKARQEHEAWHKRRAEWMASMRGLPLIILGEAFKPETNITTGSPALLMSALPPNPHTVTVPEGKESWVMDAPGVFFLGVAHEHYKTLPYPAGSLIIDPFRYMPDIPGCSIWRIGERRDDDL